MTYAEFIKGIIDERGRFGVPEGEYKERHHILPKCLGGTNDKENLIDLYAREHYIAHKLLVKDNPDCIKLSYALWNMATLKGSTKKREEITPDEYECLRKEFSKKISGKNNPNFGKHLSEEQKRAIGELNRQKAKTNLWRWGRVLSEETKRKIAKSRSGIPSATRRKIKQMNKNGEVIKIWEYITQITQELGFDTNKTAVICGPPIMIKFTLAGLVELGFDKTQVYTTMELRMKCGVGKCGRCNIGDKYVCKDGPVFRCDQLDEMPNEY